MLDDILAVSRPDKRLPSRWRTGLGLDRRARRQLGASFRREKWRPKQVENVGFLHSELHSLTIGFKKKKERKKE